MDLRFYVYVAFRPWDGTPCYVGKGKGERWRNFKDRTNRHLRNIIVKANSLGIELPVIKVREGLTEAEAFQVERAFIAAIGRGKYGPLVNLTDGGEGWSGGQHSSETKQKIRLHHLAYFGDQVMRQTTSVKTKIAMASPAIKIKTSAGQKKRYSDPVQRDKAAQRMTGKKLSAETRAKMSASRAGRIFSPETRAKLSAWQIGRKMSDDARAKMSESAKARWAKARSENGA